MSKKHHSRVQGGWAKQSTSTGDDTRQGRQSSQFTYQAPAELAQKCLPFSRRNMLLNGSLIMAQKLMSNDKITAIKVKKKDPVHQKMSLLKHRVMPAIRPPNFTWVVRGLLAGSAYPSRSHHFQYYMNEGIRHLVSLTEWRPPVHLAPAGLLHVFMPVSEFEAPSLKQLDDFTSLVDAASQKNEGVAVHCHWGLGRTGTMLAAYLVKAQGLSAQEAILEIRHQRPYSIETWEQEEAVINYAQFLRNNREQTPDSGMNDREQTPDSGMNDREQTPDSGGAENSIENDEKNEAEDEPH